MAVLWDHTRQRVGSHRSCIETPSVLCLVVQMRRPEHTTPGSCLKKCEACPACRVCRACSRAVHGLNWLQNLHPVTYMHPCGLSARPSVRIAEHLTGLMSTCQTAEHYPHPSINAQHALPQWRHKFCGTTVLCSVALKVPRRVTQKQSRRNERQPLASSPGPNLEKLPCAVPIWNTKVQTRPGMVRVPHIVTPGPCPMSASASATRPDAFLDMP